MGEWHIVVPEATINKVYNPSAEVQGSVTAVGGGLIGYNSVYQHYGRFSFSLTTAADNAGMYFTLATLANAIHYVTMRVRGSLPASWDWSLDNATYNVPVLLENIDTEWALYGYQFPAAQANGSTTLYVRQKGAGASTTFYLDGVQVEEKTYWTTYADGDQPGCYWYGPQCASPSGRSAVARSGGVRTDLDDFSFDVTAWQGFGAPAQNVQVADFAVLPGGQFAGSHEGAQEIILFGAFRSTSYAGLLALREAFIEEISSDRYPQDAKGWQPFVLWYTGGTVQKLIYLHYAGGLEGYMSADGPTCYWERVGLELIAPIPRWEALGNSAALLDDSDTLTIRTITQRNRRTGQWEGMGPPNAAGTYTGTYALAQDDTYIYIGGNFTNFDNNANANRIVRYNKITGAYTAMGSGFANGEVQTICVTPDGDVWAGGTFTLAGAANRYRVARWDGAAWQPVGAGSGMNATVRNIRYSSYDGKVYIAGDFTDINGGPGGTYNRICTWNGAAFAALGTGFDNACYGIALDNKGYVYATGLFLNADGNPAAYVAMWDTSAWAVLGAGFDAFGNKCEINSKGEVMFAGNFSAVAGGVANTLAHVCKWNGTQFIPYGKGVNAQAKMISEAPDGVIWAVGNFTGSGIFPDDEPFAGAEFGKWQGTAWGTSDCIISGAPTAQAILFWDPDPVVPGQYNVVIGGTFVTTATVAGSADVTPAGTARTFPKFTLKSSLDDSVLWTIRNETTGKELQFDYTIQAEETLYVECKPGYQRVWSDKYGDRPDAIRAHSDFAEMFLIPGLNQITVLLQETGTAVAAVYVEYQNLYRGVD